jgi:hypothetical protein
MNKQKPGLPASLLQMLGAAEKANGLPAGTMSAVMQQEIGGQMGRFLTDPSAYHYAAGPDGRRVAKHTGKVSTAFGPFGILESTAADPGYGVKPLQNKSLEEQVRFSAEYLAARSKRSGGLVQGLAAYGEGGKYGNQVASRIGLPTQQVAVTPTASTPASAAAPVVTASAPAPTASVAVVEGPQPSKADPWDAFVQKFRGQGEAPVAEKPMAQALSQFGIPNVVVPDFLGAVASASARPQAGAFNQFSGLGTWGMR